MISSTRFIKEYKYGPVTFFFLMIRWLMPFFFHSDISFSLVTVVHGR